MIPDPDLIHYACIAKGTTVLAEFNSRDAALGSVAAQCLANTPPFHATFTHTVRSHTHAFLIDGPPGFVYFAIFDERLEPPEGLAFLRGVRDAFGGVAKAEKNLKPHCFQGEFNPVFRQLLGSGPAQMEGIGSPRGHRLGETQNGSGSVSGRVSKNEKGLKKMKNKLLGGFKEEDGDNGSSRDFPLISKKGGGGLYSGEITGHQRAKRVWRKQVWVILSLDFVVCVILFAVWLWVCEGFKCIES